MENKTAYQETILKNFREAFPEMTLKTISHETGIQMTRVFRIMNGAEMKIGEYQAFEELLSKNSLSGPKMKLLEKFQACLCSLRDQDLAFMEIELNHLLKTDLFINKPFIENAPLNTAL